MNSYIASSGSDVSIVLGSTSTNNTGTVASSVLCLYERHKTAVQSGSILVISESHRHNGKLLGSYIILIIQQSVTHKI